MVWYSCVFCLSRFGFTHQNFTNYPFFLHFIRKKDPCTWQIKNLDMNNWFLWVKDLFESSCVVVSCLLPVKIGLQASKFHKFPFYPMFSQEKNLCTWWIKNTDIANWCLLWAKVWFSHSCVVVSRVLPVKIWLCTWKFPKLPIFSAFSQEQKPFHMMNEKFIYGQLMCQSQGLIWI